MACSKECATAIAAANAARNDWENAWILKDAAYKELKIRHDEMFAAFCKLSRAVGNPTIMSEVSIEDGLVEYVMVMLNARR